EVEQHAGDDERARERPAPRLVRAGDEARAEPAVEREQLPSRLLRGHRARIAPPAAAARPPSRIRRKVVLVLAQLADASLLADLAAQVVELGAADVADRAHLDLVDLGRVQRERALDADPEGVLADGERLAHAGALALDHDPLEDLDPLAVALDHPEVHAHGVARLEA